MSSDDTRSLNEHELLLQLMAMFREFDTRQREFDTRQREHDARLGKIEGVIETRLYDTRPIWEAVQHQITELRSDVQHQITNLQHQLTELRSDVQQQITELRAEVEKGFRMVNRKVGLFGEQVAELYAY